MSGALQLSLSITTREVTSQLQQHLSCKRTVCMQSTLTLSLHIPPCAPSGHHRQRGKERRPPRFAAGPSGPSYLLQVQAKSRINSRPTLARRASFGKRGPRRSHKPLPASTPLARDTPFHCPLSRPFYYLQVSLDPVNPFVALVGQFSFLVSFGHVLRLLFYFQWEQAKTHTPAPEHPPPSLPLAAPSSDT